jgi:hypothetical protein
VGNVFNPIQPTGLAPAGRQQDFETPGDQWHWTVSRGYAELPIKMHIAGPDRAKATLLASADAFTATFRTEMGFPPLTRGHQHAGVGLVYRASRLQVRGTWSGMGRLELRNRSDVIMLPISGRARQTGVVIRFLAGLLSRVDWANVRAMLFCCPGKSQGEHHGRWAFARGASQQRLPVVMPCWSYCSRRTYNRPADLARHHSSSCTRCGPWRAVCPA